jgi:hypothetical protein
VCVGPGGGASTFSPLERATFSMEYSWALACVCLPEGGSEVLVVYITGTAQRSRRVLALFVLCCPRTAVEHLRYKLLKKKKKKKKSPTACKSPSHWTSVLTVCLHIGWPPLGGAMATPLSPPFPPPVGASQLDCRGPWVFFSPPGVQRWPCCAPLRSVWRFCQY